MKRQFTEAQYFYLVKEFSFAGRPCEPGFGVEVDGWLPGEGKNLEQFKKNFVYPPIAQRITVIPIGICGKEFSLMDQVELSNDYVLSGKVFCKLEQAAKTVAEIIAARGRDCDLDKYIFIKEKKLAKCVGFEAILVPDVLRPGFVGYEFQPLVEGSCVGKRPIEQGKAVARLCDGKCDLPNINDDLNHNLIIGVRVGLPCSDSVEIETINGKIFVVPVNFREIISGHAALVNGISVYNDVLEAKEKYAGYGAKQYTGWVVYRPHITNAAGGGNFDRAWSKPLVCIAEANYLKTFYCYKKLPSLVRRHEAINDKELEIINNKIVDYFDLVGGGNNYLLAARISDDAIFIAETYRNSIIAPLYNLFSVDCFLKHEIWTTVFLPETYTQPEKIAEINYRTYANLAPEKIHLWMAFGQAVRNFKKLLQNIS